MMKPYFIFIVWALSACHTNSYIDNLCLENEDTVEESFYIPPHLASRIPFPTRNPLSANGIRLGRKLFFDPRLSSTNTISCATCHDPALAFSDGKVLTNEGASGNNLQRHTPALINLAWMKGYFWDGGAKDLESQVVAPLTHMDEMAQDPQELLTEIKNDSEYQKLFSCAFDDGITLANVMRAIAQFERTLISAHSRYDAFIKGEAGAIPTELEERGLDLVHRYCSDCHASHFFTDHDYHNNGLDDSFPDDQERLSWGRGRITLEPQDIGKFKTPTLRNIALTGPYMHDGRFNTLQKVLDHYRFGIRRSATLDPRLINQDGSLGIRLSDKDSEAIIAFLHTLTDERVANFDTP